MNTVLNAIYQHLPPYSRPLAASLWGAYLHFWRYGPETERLVAEALERESWSRDEWQSWQEQRLAFLLDRAARRVPSYRQIWQARRQRGDRRPWERLENWPLLERETLRRNPRSFVADDCPMGLLFHEQTSGTTGGPVHIWRSKPTVRSRFALYEARHRRWYGLSRFDRWAILGNKLVIPSSQQRPPFWVWNAALRQLYLSSHHLAPELVPFYFDALEHYRVRYLWGYSSSLHSLAYHALQRGLHLDSIKVVITNAESLNQTQRETIGCVFRCPVRETYGMVEFVAAAGECEQGSLHAWPEVGALETGENNELICTGLQNPDMPLIRYGIGDRGQGLDWTQLCPCGRRLPILKAIEGRVNDLLLTPDGRRVYWHVTIFHDLPIREGQIIQLSPGRLQIRYVRAEGFTSASAQIIIRRLTERVGPVTVDLLPVDHIPRGPNGKFQSVISYVTLPEQSSAQAAPH